MTGLFRIIGGGDQVVVSIALVMVADIFSEEEMYASLAIRPEFDFADYKIDPRHSSAFNPVSSWPKFWVLPSVPG